jgi:hypothetical protein
VIVNAMVRLPKQSVIANTMRVGATGTTTRPLLEQGPCDRLYGSVARAHA